MIRQAEDEDADATNETAYSRHKKIVEGIKNEYVSSTKAVFDQLSPEVFEPFSDVLRTVEGRQLSTTLLVDALKTQMAEWLNDLTNYFFSKHDVEHKLITLEVLKERFKDYEGTTWNVHNMTPTERTSKIRMLLKERCIDAMNQHLQLQEEELATVLAENRGHRERFMEIKNQRLHLTSEMETSTAFFEEMKPKLLEVTRQLNQKYKRELLSSTSDEMETSSDE